MNESHIMNAIKIPADKNYMYAIAKLMHLSFFCFVLKTLVYHSGTQTKKRLNGTNNSQYHYEKPCYMTFRSLLKF